MIIKVYNVAKEKDGSYTASLNFIEGDKITKQTTINASTVAEFKDKIRIFKGKIEAQQSERQNLLSIVQTAIDEVMAEV